MATKNRGSNQTAIERSQNAGPAQSLSKNNHGGAPADQETYFTPLMDIVETADSYLLQADLPGVDPKDLEVNYQEGTLAIEAPAASRQGAGQRYLWREYGVGRFYRTIGLGDGIDANGIRADLKNGVLSVYVPKAQSAKPRRIQVSSS